MRGKVREQCEQCVLGEVGCVLIVKQHNNVLICYVVIGSLICCMQIYAGYPSTNFIGDLTPTEIYFGKAQNFGRQQSQFHMFSAS